MLNKSKSLLLLPLFVHIKCRAAIPPHTPTTLIRVSSEIIANIKIFCRLIKATTPRQTDKSQRERE